MLGSSLLILSAAFHALWNAFVKKDGEPRVNALGVLCCAWTFTLFILIFSPFPYFSSMGEVAWGVAAGIFEGGYLITLALSLETTLFGVTYTISRGGAMVVVWLCSIFLLQEKFGWLAFLGSSLILLGIVLTHLEDRKRRQGSGAIGWAYLCAIFIAGYHLSYGQALGYRPSPIPIFALSLGVGLLLYFFSCPIEIRKKAWRITKQEPTKIIGSGILCALSFLLFLKGLSFTGAGRAISLRNTSILFAQVYSFYLGERPKKVQWIGAGLIVLGASLLAGE